MSNGFKLKKIYRVGYCVGRGFLADKILGWSKVRFYTRCFLIEHPERGLVLIDTGYGEALLNETKQGINSLYSKLLPVTLLPEDDIVSQLENDGINLGDLSYLFITHYHPDHIGALKEFANVPWIYHKKSLENLGKLSAIQGLIKGFIKSLVPSIPLGSLAVYDENYIEEWNGFKGFDIFGDQSLVIINLPGHAEGQMGVLIGDIFFCADANWGTKNLPHVLGFLVQDNIADYKQTFSMIQKIPESINIFPTHVIEAHN